MLLLTENVNAVQGNEQNDQGNTRGTYAGGVACPERATDPRTWHPPRRTDPYLETPWRFSRGVLGSWCRGPSTRTATRSNIGPLN